MKDGGKAPDVSQRIAALSPAQREMLARLLADKRQPGAAAAVTPPPPVQDITERPIAVGAPEGSIQRFYDQVNANLNSREFASHVTFLNFGYVADDTPRRAVVTLPPFHLNKSCIDLVLELVGDEPLAGRKVLDVGCGRGGTVSVYVDHFSARWVQGLDLSPNAVRFCASAHRHPNVAFLNGDAQQLPFVDGSFDVVSNVESSVTYPDRAAFYREVWRVLVPGGAFLYTDFIRRDRLPAYREELRGAGLAMEVDRDITRNVLLSRDQTASVHKATFTGQSDATDMANFLGTPGSQIYQDLAEGRALYGMFRLRKPVTP